MPDAKLETLEWSGAGPDGRPRPDLLERVTAALVEAVAPERNVLYGSGARGEMTPDGDIDLLCARRPRGPRARTTSSSSGCGWTGRRAPRFGSTL